jgi:SAM-dependent methyltransferase
MSLKHCLPEKTRIWLYWRRARTLAVIKKAGHKLGLGKFIWKLALPGEAGFWEKYLATGGKSCNTAEEFNFRISPDSEFQPWLAKWMNCPEGAEVRVLDVGAGPLTWMGKKWNGRKLVIDAIDPLAEAYGQCLRRLGIKPPVETKAGDGEDVVKLFGRQVFDLTFARNCLDHSYDAIQAVTSMIEATKPGGIIVLWHNQDEAEQLCYQGLHQWNFHLENAELVVWKGDKKLNVNRAFAGQLQVLQCELQENWVLAIYRKVQT